MKIRCARIHAYRLALAAPISTARARLTHRDGYLVELMDASGETGWGDACPIEGFGLEDWEECGAALAMGCSAWVRATAPAFIPEEIHAPAARGAFEVAAIDLEARLKGKRFIDELARDEGHAAIQTLPVSGFLVGQTQRELEACAEQLMGRGHRSLKLKVAERNWSEDRERIRGLTEMLPPGFKLRLDANGGWTESEAARVFDELAGSPIELIEQPVAADNLVAMARLRRIAPWPIAADEAIVRPGDLQRVIDQGAADVVILKPSALGGPRAAWALANRAMEAGLGVVVTSLMDSALGVAAAIQVAALLPTDRLADGLATGTLFARDLAPSSPIIEGRITVPDGKGLGLRPEPSVLAALSHEPPRVFRP